MKARTHVTYRAASLVGSVAFVALLSGCSTGSARVGPSAEADAAQPALATVASAATASATARAPVTAGDAVEARKVVTVFLDRAIAADFTGAWSLLAESDRERLPGPSALAEQFGAGQWTSYRVDTAGTGDVSVEVVQTPRINEIVGLVSPTATVVLPTIVENGSHRVRWTRRTVNQHYPSRSEATDAAVRDAVVSWAQSRQACAPPTNEYANGILGVVGLADALCRTTGIAAIGEVGDLDALDEPDPIIEGFGGSALSWARVVTLDGPVPMRVVAAPVGDGWTVIALARTSLISP